MLLFRAIRVMTLPKCDQRETRQGLRSQKWFSVHFGELNMILNGK